MNTLLRTSSLLRPSYTYTPSYNLFSLLPSQSPSTTTPPTPIYHLTIRHASKKAGGSTKNGRESESKRLGIKLWPESSAKPGAIIIRQRGFTYHPGHHVGVGKDQTLFALKNGKVKYWYDLISQRRYVSVDDGTLGHLPSKSELKAKLLGKVDIEAYMNMDKKTKYDYIVDKMYQVDAEMKAEKEKNAESFLLTRSRKLEGIDLTML